MLTIVRGLPGSGKSTLASKMAKETDSAHYEADMFFVNPEGLYEFDRNQLHFAHCWCQDKVTEALEFGSDCIVSNTFTKLSEMEFYFELCYDLSLPQPQVILCQQNFGSIHNVPNEVYETMEKRFQYDITLLTEKYK